MSLLNALESGTTYRYHTNSVMGRILQTDADHAWGVVTILFWLHPNPRLALIRAAQFHDSGEKWSSDLIAGFKRKHPAHAKEHDRLERIEMVEHGIPDFRAALSPEDDAWITFADHLEAYFTMKRFGQSSDPRKLIAEGLALGINMEEQQCLTI